MACSAEPEPDETARVRVLRGLAQRLDTARELASVVRGCLPGGDPIEIESATARLETIAQEFKLLAEEYDRLPAPSEADCHERLAREHAALETAAARLARCSAVTGGFLERLIAISRRRLDLMTLAKDGTYLSNGRASDLEPRGVRLQERV